MSMNNWQQPGCGCNAQRRPNCNSNNNVTHPSCARNRAPGQPSCNMHHTPGCSSGSMNQAPGRPSPCQTPRRSGDFDRSQRPSRPNDCNCPCSKPEKPVMSRAQLLNYINEVSFAKDDILLYLDTHPCDCEALEYCRKHVEMRNKALKEYAKHYGPLTIDTTDDAASESWEWVMQPWPWEGGAC